MHDPKIYFCEDIIPYKLDSGEVREGLVHEILTEIPQEKIIREVPQKNQQLYFLETFGYNVNPGNISPT